MPPDMPWAVFKETVFANKKRQRINSTAGKKHRKGTLLIRSGCFLLSHRK
jgi:hypothetical protein